MAKQRLATKDNLLIIGIIAALGVAVILMFNPVPIQMEHKMNDMAPTTAPTMELAAKDYYNMFQCSCCGKPIDTGCCGMAKQRKAHVDQLLLEGATTDNIVISMVKKFGFDVLMDPSAEQDVRNLIASQASDNPPVIEITNPRFDFGKVSQANGVVSTKFEVKNTGKSDLIIENMDTSCMCTTASLIYKGEESPIFGMSMHGGNPEDYQLVIPPGDSAELKVYFDPMAHGKQDKQELKLTREVTIISNDPINFQKKVRIDITQIP